METETMACEHWHVVEQTGTGDIINGFCTRNHAHCSPPMTRAAAESYCAANPNRGMVAGNDGPYYFTGLRWCEASCPAEWQYE